MFQSDKAIRFTDEDGVEAIFHIPAIGSPTTYEVLVSLLPGHQQHDDAAQTQEPVIVGLTAAQVTALVRFIAEAREVRL